jgi:hypothetical protein
VTVIAKLLWVAGVFLAFALFLTFLIANAAAQFGGTWTPAFFALPAAVFVTGILWKTFHRVFADRWP